MKKEAEEKAEKARAELEEAMQRRERQEEWVSCNICLHLLLYANSIIY